MNSLSPKCIGSDWGRGRDALYFHLKAVALSDYLTISLTVCSQSYMLLTQEILELGDFRSYDSYDGSRTLPLHLYE